MQGLRTQHAHVERAALYSIMHAHGPENARVHALCRCEAAELVHLHIYAFVARCCGDAAPRERTCEIVGRGQVRGGAVNNDLRARATHDVDTVTGR